MKELTIEQKAQRYDEAVELAAKFRKEYLNYKELSVHKGVIEAFNNIFPELKESEDERIRKEILEYFQQFENEELHGVNISDWIAWLEKQGNIQFPTFTFDDVLALQCFMETVKKDQKDEGLYSQLQSLHSRLHDAYLIEKQGEQKPSDIIPQDFEKYVEHLLSLSDGEGHGSPAKVKEVSAELFRLAKLEQNPAWSEEDEKQARQIERIVHDDGCSKKLQEQIANWFKSLKDRVGCEVNCTTTKGWSKDDEEIILKMMFAFTTRVFPSSKECGSFVDFLKSLKHTWKPSGEQMKALRVAIGDEQGSDCCCELRSLLKDLKSL